MLFLALYRVYEVNGTAVFRQPCAESKRFVRPQNLCPPRPEPEPKSSPTATACSSRTATETPEIDIT